jgi:hypothetical protein
MSGGRKEGSKTKTVVASANIFSLPCLFSPAVVLFSPFPL